MASGNRTPFPPQLTVADVDEDSQATSQEAIPLPAHFGEGPIAVRWISTPYNVNAKEAPSGSRGKK